MNTHNPFPAQQMSPLDIMLADISIRVQLSKTDYDKAVSRYGTLQDWIDRDDSPLAGRVTRMYPQGSMATGSTVARNSERDEYDIDIMTELDLPADTDPEIVLDLLFDAIRGERGSRYHDMTVRHTRCVAVAYADGMHVDLTPAIIVPSRVERTSWIFHHKQDAPNEPQRRLLANPFGLAAYFTANTPQDNDFASFYEQRSLAFDQMLIEGRAPGDPVPAQQPAYRKSRALISLQLLKRWRNVVYERRNRSGLRRPPSVLLSKLVADQAGPTRSLAEELHLQAAGILSRLKSERLLGRLIHEVNPTCQEDVLTDRWPGSHSAQDLMIADLEDFCAKMHALRCNGLSLMEMSKLLEQMFGERPARAAISEYVERQAALSQSGHTRVATGTGRILGAGIAASTPARAVPAHNFYGGRRGEER